MLSVLYVDDDPSLLNLGKIFLEMSGKLRIDTAASVGEALDKVQRRKYDGIISDYEMPGINGLEFLRHVRCHYRDLPFILFTGKGREEIAIEALNSGADFYLQKGGEQKPQFVELEHKLLTAIDRNRMRDDLKESRQQLSDLIDFLPDATFAINRENKVISWNRMMEKMTGVPPDAILGTGKYLDALSVINEEPVPLVDIVLNNDKTCEDAHPNLVWNGDKLTSELYSPKVYEGKGAFLWRIASPLYDSGGTVIGAIETIRDVTGRKEAEEKLRSTHEELNAAYEQLTATEEELRQNYDELTRNQQALVQSEERYRNVVEDQTEFICRFSPDGRHIFVNNAYCRYFGKTREELIGHKFVPDIPKEDHPLIAAHFVSIRPDHPVQTVEHRIRMPSGEIRWQQWSDRAIFEKDGRVTEYQSVGRDITDRRHKDQALHEANKKLNLLSSITRHDIINQLTALQGYFALLEGRITDPGVRDLLKRAMQTGEVIRGQILFTQQYEDMGLQNPSWQDIPTTIAAVLGDGGFSPVNVDASLNGIEVFADPLLKQVFYNLFENAFMHGEHVTRIEVLGHEVPGGFDLVVADDGCGIPPADKQNIFVKGFGSHTGLGLFLTQEILTITSLTIRETGEYGRGARFEIHIPAARLRKASGRALF
ncbi:PAS domain S-box protein [Methanoregula sp.]|uniref:PAS domain S-box protein n=1 Tax=Methanoregula sp. TaxID=2052170 RepID=UPI003BB094E1